MALEWGESYMSEFTNESITDYRYHSQIAQITEHDTLRNQEPGGPEINRMIHLKDQRYTGQRLNTNFISLEDLERLRDPVSRVKAGQDHMEKPTRLNNQPTYWTILEMSQDFVDLVKVLIKIRLIKRELSNSNRSLEEDLYTAFTLEELPESKMKRNEFSQFENGPRDELLNHIRHYQLGCKEEFA
ncbi:hypothetical protein BY996DRAFT_6506696 [Phakopsora pachyrhizi]|nr:hypothetical protein BY996DRAFT_6506696 [Phakopsora pachyrhizi]